jgi:hypothetical protein
VPSPRVLHALAIALEVSPEWLERGEDTWTGVYADGELGSVAAPDVTDALAKLGSRGDLLLVFAGLPALAWRAR